MFLAFRGVEDIRNRYKGVSGRRIFERMLKVYHFSRQPRPHESLDIYVNIRCRLIQDIKPQEYIMEVKMNSKRKELYKDVIGTYIPQDWRLWTC